MAAWVSHQWEDPERKVVQQSVQTCGFGRLYTWQDHVGWFTVELSV